MPPNTTSLIQPQDQGIIASVKKRYKSEILKRFFSSYSANRLDPNPLSKFYKDFTIKNVIFIIANIWETTPVATLKNAWRKLKINTQEPAIDVPDIELPYQTLIPNNEIQAWLNQDDSDPGWRTLSNKEIIADILNPQEAELEEEEVVVDEELLGIPEEVVMSTVEALESIQKLTKWIQHQACNTVVQLKTSFELEQFIRDRQFANYSTQSTISFS